MTDNVCDEVSWKSRALCYHGSFLLHNSRGLAKNLVLARLASYLYATPVHFPLHKPCENNGACRTVWVSTPNLNESCIYVLRNIDKRDGRLVPNLEELPFHEPHTRTFKNENTLVRTNSTIRRKKQRKTRPNPGGRWASWDRPSDETRCFLLGARRSFWRAVFSTRRRGQKEQWKGCHPRWASKHSPSSEWEGCGTTTEGEGVRRRREWERASVTPVFLSASVPPLLPPPPI